MSDLDEAVKAMQKDGGKWRRVEFWTKASSNETIKALTKLDGVANVSIWDSEENTETTNEVEGMLV